MLLMASAVEELRVISPASLQSKFSGGVPSRPALFGIPSYGVSITGRVVYATPGDRDGCMPINTSLVEEWPAPESSFIVMVRRGDCTFATKIRHAQDVGAKAVIVVDNVDENTLPYMADDGTGASITTPSLLISKSDGERFQDSFADGAVVVSMRWGVPRPDGVVEWELYTSSHDDNSKEFKAAFAAVSEALGDKARFSPRYFLLRGADYGCDGNEGTACGNQCTNHGRYCAVDPEHDLSAGIDGADVVRENLRQLCVFQVADKAGHQRKWWDYVALFAQDCDHPSKADFNEQCSARTVKAVGLSQADVDACVSRAGGSALSGGANTLFDAEIQARTDKGVYLLPTVLVNNVAFHGSLSCPEPVDTATCKVLATICEAFPTGGEPDACKSNSGCPLGQHRDECGECGGTGSYDACGVCLPAEHPDRRQKGDSCSGLYISGSSPGASTGSVVLTVLLCVGLVSIAFFYLHRRSQTTMRKELADIMQQYVPLDSQEDARMLPSHLDSAY